MRIFLVISLLLGWSFVTTNLFFSYIPSVFPVSESTKEVLTFLFPQGWGFFTKNPKEDNLVDVYLFDNSTIKLISIPNASPKNVFGMSRKSRYIRYETAVLLTVSCRTAKWSKSIGMPTHTELVKSEVTLVKTDRQYRYFEQGKEYVIIQHKIVPWAWANYHQEINNEYAYTKIKIM